jgi:hypothetical protein
MDLKGFAGFAVRPFDTSVEAERLIAFCLKNGIPYKEIKKGKCPPDLVPCGSLKWCLESLERLVIPDYYPTWLSPYFNRRIWFSKKWPLERVFIKPADTYKRFDGFITSGTYSGKKATPFWCSEVVQFGNEWRYYVTEGKVVCSGWYWNSKVVDLPSLSAEKSSAPPAPNISHIEIPHSFSGTLDFGDCNGSLTLVEAHHPIACGWYGPPCDDRLYFQWLVDGWRTLRA